MGGPTKAEKNAENASAGVTQQQTQAGQGLLTEGQTLYNQSQENLKPVTDFYSAIASGDMGKIINAAGVPLGQISQAATQSKANIMNNTPAGAGRDYAVGMNEVGKNQQIASTVGGMYTSSMDKLAQIAQGQLSGGSQYSAGGLAGFQGAQQGNQGLIQAGAARQQAKSQMFGSIFQAAGAAAGGFNFGGSKPATASPSSFGPTGMMN